MSPEPEENQNDKRPLCRDIKDFESFLLFIDMHTAILPEYYQQWKPFQDTSFKPMHRNLVIIYDLLAARALAWDFWTS